MNTPNNLKLNLEDFNNWRESNGDEFNLIDYLYSSLQQGKNHSDLFIAFSELFCPSFIEKEGYVFFSQTFSEQRFTEVKENSQEKVEFWMNLLTVDDFFIDDKQFRKKSKVFTQTLVESWTSKLKSDFPKKQFVVKYIWDEEYDDYGLTFYQA